MSRRWSHRWAVWLLPILAARALLPIGYMFAVDAGGLHVAFCPTQSPALAAAFATMQETAPAGAHAHHHHHEPDAGAETSISVQAPCPYALGAIWFSGDVPRLHAAPPAAPHRLIASNSPTLESLRPVRAERIRAPPSLS